MNHSYSYDRCIICSAGLGVADKLGYVRCGACGFITRGDHFSDEHFIEVFGEAYFQGNEYGDYLGEKFSLQANFRPRLDALARHVDAPGTRRLFEIGCAYGFFLELAQGKFAAVRGIDISSPAVEYASKDLGLDAYSGDYLGTDIGKGFDVFCAWDCIAHLKRPDLYLQKVSEDIADGGILAITTGDAGSFNARLRGRSWRLMSQPTIFHQFSRDTLQTLLKRLGFSVVEVTHPTVWRSVRAICRGVFGTDYLSAPVVKMLDAAGFLDRNVPLNLYDIMLMIAKKP